MAGRFSLYNDHFRREGIHMKRVTVFLLLVVSVSCFGQGVKSGSTVFIEPMDGYESYLAAAFAKKGVPLTVVVDENQAQYIIKSTMSHDVPSQPTVVVNNANSVMSGGGNDSWAQSKQRAEARAAARAALGSTSANISVIDPHTSQVLFAYSVGKSGSNHQTQSAAEACAKHLKEFMDKPAK
jgi:hypothetical protein